MASSSSSSTQQLSSSSLSSSSTQALSSSSLSSSSTQVLSSSSLSSSSSSSSQSSSSSSMNTNTYITKSECVELLQSVGLTNVTTSTIHNILLSSAKDMLEDMAGKTWGVQSGVSLHVDGRGTKYVFSPVTPIVSLTEVALIAKDETETTYDLSGDDRQIWYDDETGYIEIIEFDPDINIAVNSDSTTTKFTEGIENVKLTGTFGEAATDEVKLAQALIVYMIMSGINMSKFKRDLQREDIGDYSYYLAGSGDKYMVMLRSLLDSLTDEDSMAFEEI